MQNNRDTLYSEASLQKRGEKRKALMAQKEDVDAGVKRKKSSTVAEHNAVPDAKQNLIEVSRGYGELNGPICSKRKLLWVICQTFENLQVFHCSKLNNLRLDKVPVEKGYLLGDACVDAVHFS